MIHYGIFIILAVIILAPITWSFVLYSKTKTLQSEILRLNNKVQGVPDLNNFLSLLIGIDEFSLKSANLVNKDKFVDYVVNVACRLVKAASATLMLVNSENDELHIASSKGFPEDLKSSIRIIKDEGIVGFIAQHATSILVTDIEKDSRFLKTNNKRYPSKSFISVTLKVKDKVIGVLNVNASDQIESFEEKDLKLLTILADQAAMNLENIDLYHNLHDFYFEIVQTLARAIDAKDSYTFDHAGRARRYAKLIAEKLELAPEIVKQIEYAALMHDIGKIGIAEHILKKETSLTDPEKDLMKMHPIIGYNIIAPMTFLSSVAPMVLYHQEWYDGSGYPEGLSGEEIPLGARIIAVIDAYDAMTSDRPYRKSLGKEVAIHELVNGSGTQFDPNVVDVFVKILKC
jgi:HD-GYP domain-containing protein (c-di-GMP phosphodiesterase class II)